MAVSHDFRRKLYHTRKLYSRRKGGRAALVPVGRGEGSGALRMIKMTGKRFICLISLCLLPGVFAACGEEVQEDVTPQEQEQAERQIEEHSFEVELDGWGQVVFAPFMQEKGEQDAGQGNRDVQFKLLRNGKTVYTFPARYTDDVLQGQECEGVAAVSFYDYNDDGRTDIMLLIEYTGGYPEMETIFYEPRLYTQEERELEFHVDVYPMEFLFDYRDNIADMKKGLEDYARKYEMVTGNSTWEVERFAKRIKRLILAGDFEGLAENMVFPIRIDETVYIDKAAYMKAEFVTNPRPSFIEKLKMEPCEDLFYNYSGIMMGNGLCWILDEGGSQGLKVYAINGITPER